MNKIYCEWKKEKVFIVKGLNGLKDRVIVKRQSW